MIRLLRSKGVSRKIFIFLTVIIGLSFFVSGAIYYISDSKAPTFLGKIGSRKVSVQEYLQSYRAVLHQAALIYGDQLEKVRPFINFRAEAWDRLLLLHQAKSERISVRDQEVVEWVRRQSIFQSDNQQFDNRYYETVVTQYLRTTLRDFEEEIRQMLTIARLREKIIGKTTLSDDELMKFYALETAGQNIVVGFLSLDGQRSAVTVKDEDLQELLPLVRESLIEPEKIKLRYVYLPNDSPSSENALADPASVTDTAAKYALQISETPYFSRVDSIDKLGLEPQVLYAAVSLSIGQSSDWISGAGGSYKVEVVERIDQREPSFDEIRDQLKELAIRQKANEATFERLKLLCKDLTPDKFESALAASGVRIERIDGYKPDSEIPGVGISPRIADTVRALKNGQMSDVLPLQGGAAVIKLIETASPDPSAFEQVKEDLRKRATEEHANGKMDDLLRGLRDKLELNIEAMNKIFPKQDDPVAPAGKTAA